MREDEFIKLLNEAIWIREFEVNKMEEALAKVLGKMFGYE